MKHPKNYPPGPRFPLPFIGDSYRMADGSLTKTITSMRAKYGDTFGFYFTGNMRVVFVCDPITIQEVANDDDFVSRWRPDFAFRVRGGKSCGTDLPGVLFGTGKTWREQRRFTLSTLRDFGFGKRSMEQFISEELEKFIEFLEVQSQSGKHSLYPNQLFSLTVVNSLWKMINGTSFDLHDPKLNNLIGFIDDFAQQVSKITVNLTMAYNSLEFIFEALGITRAFETWRELLDVGSETIAEHVENFDANAQPSDYIDAYLARIHSEANPESSFFGKSGHLNLRSTLADVFFAGIETTTTTLTWAMLFMAKYTDVQLKVQEELDCVIGRGRLPNLSDRAFTPYTEATIHEIQRKGNVLPLGVPHMSPDNKTTKINGYDIPPNTYLLLAFGEMLNDPKHFERPEEFNPDRFIQDGKFVPNPRVVPFGTGKRKCLGETLAKAQLYMYFACIMQRYSVVARSELSTEPESGFVFKAKRFEVGFVPR